MHNLISHTFSYQHATQVHTRSILYTVIGLLLNINIMLKLIMQNIILNHFYLFVLQKEENNVSIGSLAAPGL